MTRYNLSLVNASVILLKIVSALKLNFALKNLKPASILS